MYVQSMYMKCITNLILDLARTNSVRKRLKTKHRNHIRDS
jgi:hypothetical protein